MDLRKVKKLIELVEESGIAELEVSSGDESIRIAMPSAQNIVQAPAVAEIVTSSTVPTPTVPTPAAQSANVVTSMKVTAPMAGTFYRAPSPEASVFVEVGQNVAAGDVVCIIESMKMMHEIRSTDGGVIEAIPIANGTPISTGDTLFVLS